MLHQNQTAGCRPCQHGRAENPQTRWRRNGTGARPPRKLEATPPLPKTQSAPTGSSSGAHRTQIVNLPAGYAYSHTYLPCAESFMLHASAQDNKHDTHVDPAMLTDEGTSTGFYTICCVVMLLTSILKTRAACHVNLQVMTIIDRKAWDFGDNYHIFICIIKEQCCDQEESK